MGLWVVVPGGWLVGGGSRMVGCTHSLSIPLNDQWMVAGGRLAHGCQMVFDGWVGG